MLWIPVVCLAVRFWFGILFVACWVCFTRWLFGLLVDLASLVTFIVDGCS